MSKRKAVTKKPRSRKPVEPLVDMAGNLVSPGDVRDTEDPGDDTQRRFRYQHGYGVILLTGIASGRLPYKSIWCEHHDDFLAQLNGTFNSYQVKTRIPELGAWDLKTDGFIAAVSKFATLETRFPGKLEAFKFVSNARTFSSNAATKIGRSPDRLIDAIARASSEADVEAPFNNSLATLASDCYSTSSCIFNVFKRLQLIVGPSLDDFEAVLSHTHIAHIDACCSLPAHQLNAIRDELIQHIYDASSRFVDDPSKHWCCVNGPAACDPRVQAKQLFSTLVGDAIRAKTPPYFRFSPISTKTDERMNGNDLSTLERKFIRGHLRQQMETMRRRTISTEQHLLELAASRPKEIVAVRNQLESVVQGVCDDSKLQNTFDGAVSGTDMLSQIQKRLQKLADDHPSMIYHQPYECLVGMAGLLTEACSVWWSEQFDLEEESA